MDDAPMGVPFSSLPVPELNQGGELKSTFLFLSSVQVGFILGTFFFPQPHPPTHPGLTYLSTFRLLAYAPWPPPSAPPPRPYPPICLHSHLCTYL